FGESLFEGCEGRACVGVAAHHDDTTGNLPFAVEIGDSPANLRPEADVGNVLQHHGHAVRVAGQRDVPQILEAVYVARGSHHVLGLRELDDRAAGLAIACFEGRADLGERHPVGTQFQGVQNDLVFLHHPADRGDLGYAWHGLQLISQCPVLESPQLCQIVASAAVDESVFVDPADS